MMMSLNILNQKIDIKKLNNLNFSKPNLKNLSLKILNQLPNKNSLFETISITANDGQ